MDPPRILDPHAVPVAGTDAHLQAIPLERLGAQALRQRFACAGPWEPEIHGDGAVMSDLAHRAPTRAAVLVPLMHRPDGLHVLLTQRSTHLRGHAGQISFPGGRAEPGDIDPVATALREAQEEVGLPPAQVEVLGHLPVYTTVTRYIVTPVVALVQPPATLVLDRFEVAEAFEVPLAFLMDPARHQRHVFEYAGGQRQFLSMPWPDPVRAAAVGHEIGPRATADAQADCRFIWGATAAMLRNLYRFLSV